MEFNRLFLVITSIPSEEEIKEIKELCTFLKNRAGYHDLAE